MMNTSKSTIVLLKQSLQYARKITCVGPAQHSPIRVMNRSRSTLSYGSFRCQGLIRRNMSSVHDTDNTRLSQQHMDSTHSSTSKQVNPLSKLNPFSKEKVVMLDMLRARRRKIIGLYEPENFAQVMGTVTRIKESNPSEADSVYAIELFNLVVQLLTLRGHPYDIDTALNLLWHTLEKPQYFQSKLLSKDICNLFHVIASAILSTENTEKLNTLSRLVDTLEALNLKEPNFELSRFAMSSMLEYYSHTNQDFRALYLLDFMVIEWKKGNKEAMPNLFCFNATLTLCGGSVATKIVEDMAHLSQEDTTRKFPKPSHVTILLVLAAFVRDSHPLSGDNAERFLRWAVSAHDQGLVDFTQLNMRSAAGRVIEAWSVSKFPDAGPRSDVLLMRVLDQYENSMQKAENAPVPLSFAWNAMAWIQSSSFWKTGDGIFLDKFMNVLDRMEKFGQRDNWSPGTFAKIYWHILECLEQATMAGENKNLDGVGTAITGRIQTMGVDTNDFLRRFQILQLSKADGKGESKSSGKVARFLHKK